MSREYLKRALHLHPQSSGTDVEEEEVAAVVVVDEVCNGHHRPCHRGSVMGRQIVRRNILEGHDKLFDDYFSDNPVYNEDTFCRRFRMTKGLFLHIMYAVTAHDDYFTQRPNAANQLGCSPLQKVTAALRMLSIGCSADSLDSDLRMSKTTILESLLHFVRVVVHLYKPYYHRRPNDADIAGLLEVAEERGFPGMLGSIDCMHWTWEKCPTAWQGFFKGHTRKPTLILEAIAGHDLWICHAFFGLPGSLNDINVLHRSPVFDDLASGNAAKVNFHVNGRDYDMGYYLGDGIYPDWATLVKGIRKPLGRKQMLFTKKQQEYRKDVERAFGVLQAKFQICKGPSRNWFTDEIELIMDCVVILHNMIVENERSSDLPEFGIHDYEGSTPPSMLSDKVNPTLEQLIAKHHQIESREGHHQLQADLIEHIWAMYGRQ